MYLLFDIGGTNTRVSVSKDGETVEKPTILPTEQLFRDGMARFVETARALSQGSRITACAGGVPGALNGDKTMVSTAPNIPDWNNKPLKETLERELNTTVFLENDTAMVGMGEANFGAGRGKRFVSYITVSTGVGGCNIIDGFIAPNVLGFEPGHQTIDMEGPMCGCGEAGHLEAFVSGSAFVKRYGKPAEKINDKAIWEEASYHLAVGLTNIMAMWSPQTMILGGSLMLTLPIERVRHHMSELVSVYPAIPPIEKAALGQSGGLIGSLFYLKQQGY